MSLLQGKLGKSASGIFCFYIERYTLIAKKNDGEWLLDRQSTVFFTYKIVHKGSMSCVYFVVDIFQKNFFLTIPRSHITIIKNLILLPLLKYVPTYRVEVLSLFYFRIWAHIIYVYLNFAFLAYCVVQILPSQQAQISCQLL